MADATPADVTAPVRLVRRRGSGGFVRRHRLFLGSLAGVVLLSVAAGLWAVNYDHRSSHFLLPGTTIGGVSVGGLDYAAAVQTLQDRLEAPLHRPMLVRADEFEVRTTAWDLGRRIDVRSAVRRAMTRSHDGNLVDRIWRRLSGQRARELPLSPRWSSGQVSAILSQAAKAVSVPAQDARLDTSTGFVGVVPEKEGRALDDDQARRVLVQAAEHGTTPVVLPTSAVVPNVRASALSTVILVRVGENRLYLYKDGKVVKSYPVATGQAAYPTPTGTWKVLNKLVNPVWVNPGSAWAAKMPAKIEAGPGNPLGTRALALSAPGILIHATSDASSIGWSASHGCVRMLPQDEMDLFSQVPVGTPVVIVSAGPPRPRPVTPAPAPATPDQVAVVQY